MDPGAPDWLGCWTLIGQGAGRTEERSSGSPRGKAGGAGALERRAQGTTGRLRGGAGLHASGSDCALRRAVTRGGVREVRLSRASEGAGRETVKILRRAHRKLP